MPIRWVIDYHLGNADSGVAKLPLPHIGQSIDRMCDVGQASVDFLGHTISAEGLHVDARKTRAIAEWAEPSNVKDLQRFLGLVGYYRRFIHQFATLVLPLSSLVKKCVVWVWGDGQCRAFNAIKLALQHAPVLLLPDFDKQFIVTTVSSHVCIGEVLSQLHDGNDLPLAFFSKKLGPHELNWPDHEKELFAIKQELARWRCGEVVPQNFNVAGSSCTRRPKCRLTEGLVPKFEVGFDKEDGDFPYAIARYKGNSRPQNPILRSDLTNSAPFWSYSRLKKLLRHEKGWGKGSIRANRSLICDETERGFTSTGHNLSTDPPESANLIGRD
ncbi:unnamed protein product [Phytophthora fragariaefolia]|uniref:Unnamed protein product n=1 Tax=Phytophthora fragariaefolia TaxID=1490495 RepID=A0A9W7DAT3_9STRA|nr:unnamed protein product [Phytophthora fragariaefolia]